MDEAEGAGFVPAGTTRPAPVPPFDCATYSMLFFKVLPCQKVWPGWSPRKVDIVLRTTLSTPCP